MNKIDPDEEEEDPDLATNGPGAAVDPNSTNPIPNQTTPVKQPKVSFATPSKSASKRSAPVVVRDEDAYVPGQGRQQPFVKYQNSSNSKEQPRSRSTRAAGVAATAAVSGTTHNSGSMMLDPETGEMVPTGSDGEENYDDDDCYEDDDVQVVQSAKPVLINLGQLKGSSSSSNTNSSSKNNLQVCV